MVSIIPFKNIGDELSDDNLNAIVSLLRNNKVLNENITVKNGDVQGEYGKYTFNLQSTTIVDNGVLITDETLTNLGTVKLSNPSFSNATYTLYLTVYTMEDANIMIEETTSNIEETTLEIELENGTAVNIPFNTLNYSCIVGFDAIVSIKQDKPEIKGAYVTGINITATKDTIQTGDTTTFTFKATDLDTHGVPGKTIKVYKNSTLWQTLTTDNNGECSVSYTGEGAGIINITAGYGGIILSEIYGIVDAIYYDPCTNNTTSRYIVNTTDGNSLSFVNNSMRLTIGSNNKYVNLDTNSAYATLSDYAGKTIRFTADIKPSNRCRLICYQQVSGSWSEVHTDYTTTEGTLTLDIEIAENASRVQFRVDCSNGNSGDTVDINNWTLHTF